MKMLRSLYWPMIVGLATVMTGRAQLPWTLGMAQAAEPTSAGPAAGKAKATPNTSTKPKEGPIKLGQLAKLSVKTDKGPEGHNYVELYERFIGQWRSEPIKLFEIGIEKGGSLLMWQEYFPKAKIYGVDIADSKKFDTKRIKTIVGDQSKRDQLKQAIDISGPDIDVLIDDGGHTMEQQQVSLGYLFPFVKSGGYYILEDVHTSLPETWPGWGKDPDNSNTTLRMILNYVGSDNPQWKSKYMLPEEMKYLNEHVDYVNLIHRMPKKSIVCIFKKK